MPKLMTDGGPSRDDQIRAIIEKMTPKTMKQDKKRLLTICAQLGKQSATFEVTKLGKAIDSTNQYNAND